MLRAFRASLEPASRTSPNEPESAVRLLYQYYNGRPALIDAMINDELGRLFAELHSQVPDKGFVDTLVELSVTSAQVGRDDPLLDDLFDNSSFTDVAALMEQQGSPAHRMMMALWSPVLARGRAEGVSATTSVMKSSSSG